MNKLKKHSVTKNCSDLSLFEQIFLVIFFLTVGQNNFGNKIPFLISGQNCVNGIHAICSVLVSWYDLSTRNRLFGQIGFIRLNLHLQQFDARICF